MLRILFISLVVANLLLLAFQSDKPAVQPKTTATRAEIKDAGIPTIHLFSEIMEDQGLMSSSRQCFTLGPFHSSDDADDIRARLQEVTTHISERQTEALVEKGYWVFMPPYDTLLEANKALFSLQALGLEDIAILYEGDWKNAISLGYFLRQQNAQRRKKDLEDRGFAPKMRIQRQAEPRFWLDYEQVPGSELIALDMQSRPNDFIQRPVPCPEQDFVEFTGGASQLPEQDSPIVAEAVSPAPEQAGSDNTGVAVKKPAEDTPEVASATSQSPSKAVAGDTNATVAAQAGETRTVSQAPEKAGAEDPGTTGQNKSDNSGVELQVAEKAEPEDAGAITKDPGQEKPEADMTVNPATEQAIPETTDTAQEASGQGEAEVTGASAEDLDQAGPEDANMTSQAPAEYLPRPQAIGEVSGTDAEQGDDTEQADATAGEPVDNGEVAPQQAIGNKAETDGEDGTGQG